MLYNTVELRAQSIKGQLDETIPSTEEGQSQYTSSLIDASSIDISVMGQMSMGGEMINFNQEPQNNKESSITGDTGNFPSNMGSDESNTTPPNMGNGENNFTRILLVFY